jgi:hypothetical protein
MQREKRAARKDPKKTSMILKTTTFISKHIINRHENIFKQIHNKPF